MLIITQIELKIYLKYGIEVIQPCLFDRDSSEVSSEFSARLQLD